MLIIRDIENFPSEFKNAVLLIGNFDSVHLAHQSLISAAKSVANASNKKLILMSFYPHPRYYFKPDSSKIEIEPIKTRLNRLRSLGIDAVILMRFNERLANLTAEDFTQNILKNKLDVSNVFIGEDFRFGKGRTGGASTIRKYGIQCSAFKAIMQEGNVVSSTMVRSYLGNGEMQKASKMLGRPYSVAGIVRKGAALGQEIGTPTANLIIKNIYNPRFGVYICNLNIDGKNYDAISNIGVRPTFYDASEVVLEVHSLLPVPSNLYGKKITVELLQFIRDEQKFDNAKALQQQIKHDIEQAQQYFFE
jgi:riboflavin kinase/FMN adenylyltransferase